MFTDSSHAFRQTLMALIEASLGMNYMSVDDFFKETCLHMLSDVSFLILLNINRQYNCFMGII
jgi:hypothetical protein